MVNVTMTSLRCRLNINHTSIKKKKRCRFFLSPFLSAFCRKLFQNWKMALQLRAFPPEMITSCENKEPFPSSQPFSLSLPHLPSPIEILALSLSVNYDTDLCLNHKRKERKLNSRSWLKNVGDGEANEWMFIGW